LNRNSKEKDKISFRYNGKSFVINNVEKIKICGLYYCSNEDEEYQLNVVEKIKKIDLQNQTLVTEAFNSGGKN
jgi:hypothetical protein